MSATAIYAKSNKVEVFPFSSTRGDAVVYQAEESSYAFSSPTVPNLESSDIIYLTTEFVEDLTQDIPTCDGYVSHASNNVYSLEAGKYYVVFQTERIIPDNKVTISYYIQGTNEEYTCQVLLENINNSGTYKGQCPIYISTIVSKSTYELSTFAEYRSAYTEVILESIENRNRLISEGNMMNIVSSITERRSFVTSLDLISATIEFVMAGHYFKLTDGDLIKAGADLWARIIICGPPENRILLGADKFETHTDTETIFDGVHLFTEEPEEVNYTQFSHVLDPQVFEIQLLESGNIPFASQCRFNQHGVTHVYGGTC